MMAWYTNIDCWHVIPMMNELKRIMEKQKDDILFMEKQMHAFESLTEKRMQMVRVIMHRQPNSIRDLAEILHRDIKNVFDDLKVLDHMGVVRFIKIGRKKRPVVKRKVIVISLE